MQLSYKNLYTTFDLKLLITHHDRELELSINKTLDRSVKNRGDSFSLINDWLSVQSDEFQTKLFDKMCEATTELMEGLGFSYESEPIPVLWEILDMFDLDKIKQDLVRLGYTYSPELPVSFNEEDDATSTYSKVNTYVQSDYMDLIAFLVPSKIIGGLLSHLVFLRHGEFGKIGAYHAFFAVRDHKIYTSNAYLKLAGMVLARDAAIPETDKQTRTIKTMLGSEEAVEWVLATTMLTIAFSAHFPKLPTKSLSVLLFNNSKSKLEVSPGGLNTKTPSATAGEEKESVLETHRYASDLEVGADEGIRVAFSNLEIASRAMSFDLTPDVNEYVKEIKTKYLKELPPSIIVDIVSNITYHIHPDLTRADLDGIVNAVALAAKWADVNNLEHLKNFLLFDKFERANLSSKNKVKLSENFTQFRDKKISANIAEEQVKNLVKELTKYKYTKDDVIIDSISLVEEFIIAIETA